MEKRERGLASLRTLDNESLVPSQGNLAFGQVARHWADLIQDHIETAFLAPTEALLDAASLAHIARLTPMNQFAEAELPPGRTRTPADRSAPSAEVPPLLPAASLQGGGEVELTFEIVPEARPPEAH